MQPLTSFSPSPLPQLPHMPRAVGREPIPGYGLGFYLFLLVNAVLFVRPGDIIPDLLGWEFYLYTILACFLFSFPVVLSSLAPEKLESRPIDLCVLGLLPAIGLSLLFLGNRQELFDSVFNFFKVIIYYLLLVSLVTTPKRLRIYLACIAFFAVITVGLSILDFHKYIQLPRAPSRDASGRMTIDPTRMYGPGIFADPNDVCVLIATSLMIVLGRMGDKRLGQGRFLWIFALAVFAYGFYLTQSRGGLMALFAGLGTFIYLRFGWRNALLLGIIIFPGVLALLGARQSSLTLDAETGQARVGIWSDGLNMVRNNPLFGVGWRHFNDHSSHVAHNTYVQMFGELGMFGGTLFLGACWLAISGLIRLSFAVRDRWGRAALPQIIDPDLKQVYPYLAGAVVAYSAGMFSLSLNELVTTYAMLGVAGIFLGMGRTAPPKPPIKFEITLPLKCLLLSVCFLIGMFILIRVALRV